MFWDHVLFPGWIHKKGGVDHNGTRIYVARAPHEGSLVPGKWRAACCWIRSLLIGYEYRLLCLIFCFELSTLHFALFQNIFDSWKGESRWIRPMSLIFCLLIDQFSLLLAAFPCFVVNKVIYCQPRRRGGCQGLRLWALDWRWVSVGGCQGWTGAWGRSSGGLKR